MSVTDSRRQTQQSPQPDRTDGLSVTDSRRQTQQSPQPDRTDGLSVNSSSPALHCENLRVRLDRREVLHGVSLSVAAGEWLGLIGPNGSGKTTLLHAVAGILRYEGRVLISSEDAAQMRSRRRARLVSLVTQNPVLPAGMSAVDYVLLGRTPHRGLSLAAGSGDYQKALSALESLGVAELAERPLNKLSGGERQRVATARALAQETPLLLLDEPTSSLDVGRQLEVLELIDEMRRGNGLTVVSALHDLSLAGQFADRLMLLADGRFEADGRPAEVLSDPAIGSFYGTNPEVLTDDRGTAVVVRRSSAAGAAGTASAPGAAGAPSQIRRERPSQ